MKRLSSSIPIVFMVFLALSCKTAPAAEPGSQPEPGQGQGQGQDSEQRGEFTQEHVNAAFEKVYETHQSLLVLDGARDYTVERGDTASRIAGKFYGPNNGYFFPLILLASSDVILDPDLIEPGMKFVIPDLQKNLANSDSRKRIRAFLLDIAGIYEKKTSRWASATRGELIKLAETL